MSSGSAGDSTLRIELLDAHAQLIPLLAGWYHGAWNDIEGLSLEVLKAELADHLPGSRRIGTTWVAFEAGRPVGTVSVDVADLPGHEHLSPWLASFYVVTEHRGAGIGRALLRHAQQHAAATGTPVLYLWTRGTTRLYEEMGWRWHGTATLGGTPIVVMRWDEIHA